MLDLDRDLAHTNLIAYHPQRPGGVDWPELHENLAHGPWPTETLLQVTAQALYQHCVAKAFEYGPDVERAQKYRDKLLTCLPLLPTASWSLAQLDVACLLAWLDADGVPVGSACLAELDAALGHEALRLLSGAGPGSRRSFFQVLRYFSLRAAPITAHSGLQVALQAWPGCLAPPSRSLSLVQGTAAELLICMRLVRAGLQVEPLTRWVRDGVRRLLSARHQANFELEHYAIFPDEWGVVAEQHGFSARLHWRCGDLGPALVFYEAHRLLADPELARYADLVGLHTLLRHTPQNTEINGSSLYNGAAGVAQLYYRLYQLSGQAAYLRGYQHWLGQTQHWLQAELASGAHLTVADPLRYGLAGVALVLLSANTEKLLGWENYVLGAS